MAMDTTDPAAALIARNQRLLMQAAHSGDHERSIRSIMNTESGDHEHALAII
jgi:hypothetical protein